MSNKEYANHDICFLARIVIEATTPLKIGSGRSSVKTDALINRDVNGLPYIPATTLQGLMRHALNDEDTANRIMGWQDGKNGHGSWLSISEAKIVVDKAGHTVDGLLSKEEIGDNEYLRGFKELPVRQHVRITHRGVAADKGKFDEEIVPKGVRFCFEMELRADKQGSEDFHKLLNLLQNKTFRIGGGSRKGFGEIEVGPIGYRKLDFRNNKDDFHAYIKKDSSLKNPWELYQPFKKEASSESNCINYTLELHPVDFILFSSGLGDEKTGADSTIIHEKYVDNWDSGKPKWEDGSESLVIPASSFKGAIAHRTAYYYNSLTGVTADKQDFKDEKNLPVGKNNEAVKFLFGSEGDKDSNKEIKEGTKRRGRVLFSDIIRKQIETTDKPKILNHVKIDRFTGGAIEGALFDEMPLYAPDEKVCLNITVIDGNAIDEDITKAFTLALIDICRGTLPLGGNTNHGNGCFHGKLTCNSKTIYEYGKD